MFLNRFGLKSKLSIFNNKFFSTTNHSNILIVGGGTGGITVANQLVNNRTVSNKDITIFDPSNIHYYRPGFTKLAGGVIENEAFFDKFIRYDMNKLTRNFNFENHAVAGFNPEQNQITLQNGDVWTYDHLIVSAGLQINPDSIPGLKPLLDDESKSVGTIYLHNYAQKTSRIRKNFNGKRAVFTQPPPPITCAGAPQKIMYLSDSYWKSKGIQADIHFVTPLPKMFGIQYYSEKLNQIVKDRNYNTHYSSVVLSVDENRVYCQNTATKDKYEIEYDFLHVTPNMSAPSFLKGQPICDSAGFVQVGADLRHIKYNNVWALGDCVTLPNAKTAAAVFSQAPTLVFNLNNQIKNLGNSTVTYDGYSACPIFLGNRKLMLAEFRVFNDPVKNEAVTEIDESFHPGNQTIPSTLYYYVTKSFFFCYNCALRGHWYGKHSFYYPFERNGNKRDYRYLYKYLIPGVFGGFAGLFFLFFF
jgi:sulfide:quinone oxidoreductase